MDLGSCWVVSAWLLDGRDDWGRNIIWRSERLFVFLSGAMTRFPPSSSYEYWRHMPPRVVLCFFAFIYAHTSYSSTSGLVVFPSTGVVCRLGLFCFFSPFFSISVSFASLPLCHSFVLASILFFLAMGSGAGDAVPCRFGVGLSVFTVVLELVSRPIWLDMVGRS